MAFIGNTVQNQGFAPAIDYFSGNGSTVTFTLSRPVASVAQMIVVIANVPQNPSSAYVVSGNAITFSSAPPSGTNNIWVEYTSLITTYAAISQSPSVIGDITASGGYLAVGSFGNSFIDGTVVDYVTGNGRITVGPSDGFTLYNGGTSARNALMTIDASGRTSIGAYADSYANLKVSNTLGAATNPPWQNATLTVFGDATMAQGTGAVISLEGNYVTGTGSPANLAWIKAAKSSATSGSATGDLILGARGGSIKFSNDTTNSGLSTQLMTINSSGYVTMPYQPTVEVNRQSNFAVTSNENVGTVVPFVNVRLNVGSNYSLSTNKFTAPVAGNYEFHWSYGCNNSSNTVYRTYLWINGVKQTDTQLRNDNSKTGTAYTFGSRTIILGLAVNDYVELRASSDNATDFYADGTLQINLGICLLG